MLYPTFVVSPADNSPCVTGYIAIPTAQLLEAKINFGFKPSRIDMWFCSPDVIDGSKVPMCITILPGIGYSVRMGQEDADANQFLTVATGAGSIYGAIYNDLMTNADLGGHGISFGTAASGLGLLYTRIVFCAFR